MAAIRTAEAHWEGSLKEGQGEVELVSSGSRELRGQLAGSCRAAERQDQPRGADRRRALHLLLDVGGQRAGPGREPAPTSVDTKADVTFQPGEGITGIELTVKCGRARDRRRAFSAAIAAAEKNCPVSRALTGTTITVDGVAGGVTLLRGALGSAAAGRPGPPWLKLPTRSTSPLRTYQTVPLSSRSWVTRSPMASTVPGGLLHVDEVADPELVLHQHEDARHQVLHDALDAERDGQRQRPKCRRRSW